MKVKYLLIRGVLSLGVLLGSAAAFGESEDSASSMIGAPRSDEDLVRDIRKSLTDDKTLSAKAKNITITSHKGIVNLSGKVRDQEEKTRVIEKANSVAEKRNVQTKLEIDN